MKRRAIFAHPEGSAELVLAHARYQRTRGRNPSMSYVGQRNPAKALELARVIVENDKWGQIRTVIRTELAKRVPLQSMTRVHLEAAVRSIVVTSSSEEEVHRRLKAELSYHDEICLHTSVPTDETGREARELVRGLGGLVMKNGAMASVMLRDNNGEVIMM